jgi:HD superfamily phosphodiesterase
LHDIGRADDKGGTEHALIGAQMAPRYCPKDLTAIEKQTIAFAIAHHADLVAPNGNYPTVSNFPQIRKKGLIEGVIATLWDADRIELLRLGFVFESYLSTAFAKKLLINLYRKKTFR